MKQRKPKNRKVTFSVLLSVFVLIAGLFVPLITGPQAAYAESAIQATFDKGKKEYDSYMAYQYFRVCFPMETYLDKDAINAQTGRNEDWRGSIPAILASGSYNLGTLVVTNADDYGEISCKKASHADTFAKLAGYADRRELLAEFYPLTVDNCDQPGHANQCKVGGDRAQVLAKIKARIAQKGDGTTGDLSAVGQYWYFNYAYRNSQCKGILTSTESKYAGHNTDLRQQGPFSYVGNDGMLKQYNYAIWKDTNIDDPDHEPRNDGAGDIILQFNSLAFELNEGVVSQYGNGMGMPSRSSGDKANSGCRKLAQNASRLAPEFFAALGNAVEACLATGAEDCRNPATNSSSPTEGEQELTGAQAEETCESKNVGLLGFLVCAFMRVTVGVVSGFIDWFVEILNFNLVEDQEDVLRSIWLGFRNIANVGFVVAFIAVIYAAATGNMFSAYDIKKLLPRVLLGAVGVQLSFFITTEMLRISNEIGEGAGRLLLAPIAGAGGVTGLASSAWNGVGGAIGGLAVGILVVVGLIIASIYSIGGILVMTIVFLLRNAAIIVLIVLAPVAWVVPGKISKRWWSTYIQLLMLYPIATIFLASGQLVGAIWLGSNAGGSFSADKAASHIFGVIAIFAPYFLAPKMFGFAGQSIQALSGAVDRTKAGTWNKMLDSEGGKRFKAKAAAGEFTKRNGAIGSKVNRIAAGMAAPGTLIGTSATRVRSQARAAKMYGAMTREQAEAEAYVLNKGYTEKASQGDVDALDTHGRVMLDSSGKPIQVSAGKLYLEQEFEAARVKGDEAKMMAVFRMMGQTSNFDSMSKATSKLIAGSPADAEMAKTLIESNLDSIGSKAPSIAKQLKYMSSSTEDEVRLNALRDTASSATTEQLASMKGSEIEQIYHTLGTRALAPGAAKEDIDAYRAFVATAQSGMGKEVESKYSPQLLAIAGHTPPAPDGAHKAVIR